MTAKRYFVFILLDEPRGLPETYGFRTAGWNATPTAGRVIDRIAPFLGVQRQPVAAAATPPATATAPLRDETGGGL